MDNNEIHYLTYDEEALWDAMIDAYLDELRTLQPSLSEPAWRAALPHFVL